MKILHLPPAIPHEDQVWGCASCGPGYESAWMTHYYADKVHWHWNLDGGATEHITVKAKTKMTLLTGGKAGVNRKNLILINAGAVQYFEPPLDYDPENYPWWDVPSATVDPTTIKVLGWWIFGHHTDSRGNLYRVLPDNAAMDLNLRIPGVKHYSADPTVAKYPLVIAANGNTLSNGVVASGANFCVGQFVPFTAGGWPDDSGVIATNFQWTLGGTFYNEGTNSVPGENYPTCSINYFVNASLLTSNTTTAWWVSGGPDANTPKAYPASVTCTLIFTNGNPSAKVSASGLFNMWRPKATISPVTTSVNIYQDYTLAFRDNSNEGIIFSNTVTYPTNFSGSIKWIQTCSSIGLSLQDATTNHVRTQLGWAPYGDTPIPYEFITNGIPYDSPFLSLPYPYLGAQASGSFQMTMMFVPPEAGVWVPLRVVSWH